MTELMFEPLDVVDEYYEPEDWQTETITSIMGREQHVGYSADWSEMGCYKTTTGLWLLQQRANKFREESEGLTPISLIVTSKAGKGTYFDAIPKSRIGCTLYTVGVDTVRQRIGDLEIPKRITEIKREGNHIIFLAHYEVFSPRVAKDDSKKLPRLSIVAKYLKQLHWTNMLLDEGHKIKNKDTKWTRQLKRIRAVNKHIMTGTGFVNRPDELWSLLHFLNQKEWPSYWGFRDEFCDEYIDDSSGYRIVQGTKSEKLDELIALQKSLGPRFFMRKVHSHIKEPIETQYTVDLNPIQRRMFDEIKHELYTLDQKGEPITSPNVLSALNRMRQISVATPTVTNRYYDEDKKRMVQEIQLTEPSSKLDKVMDIVDEIRWDQEVKQQVVIFSSYKDPLKLLEKRFEKLEVMDQTIKEAIPYIHLQTSHSDEERYRLWHDIFPSKEHKVFMSTLQLGGESINLACAQYLIFLDRDWSPKNMMQAIGRIYRPGQEGVPEIIYINARNSIDARVRGLLDIKGKWFNQVFGDHDEVTDDNGNGE